MFWRKSTKAASNKKDIFPFEYDTPRVLYSNDFETALNGWTDRGPEVDHFNHSKYFVKIELTDEEKHRGNKCMKISGRQEGWNGATLNITPYLKENILNYEAMIWIKLRDKSSPCKVRLSLETNSMFGGVLFPCFGQWDDFCNERGILSKYRLPLSASGTDGDTWDTKYPAGYTTDDGWILLRGKAEIRKSQYISVFAYIETDGETNTNDIYADDFVLLKGE